MTITVQLSADELKELLGSRKTKAVLEDFIAPKINTRLCIKCNAEFTGDDKQHYCTTCRSQKKGPG